MRLIKLIVQLGSLLFITLAGPAVVALLFIKQGNL
nr:photosystem II reaction center protein Ycf12/Psb30 [Flexiglena variabilis]WCH63469.1 photosystem II reaction center protein Ycf12/Psb30 [Flexiglena variabilis]